MIRYRINPLVAELTAPPIAEVQQWVDCAPDPDRASLLDVCQAVPSYGPPIQLIEHLADRINDPETARYTEISGLPELREAMSAEINQGYGGSTGPGQITIASGCNQAFCAVTETIAAPGDQVILILPWYFNRHVADDSTATMSFDAWKRNVVQGMEWDADAFQTNMWAHPYHGNVYFNAARSNGYNFWQSSAWAWGGSFLWEMFGENNRPAINDWAATAIGGIALGESLNRMSRLIWDNSATGFSRTLREFGGFLVNYHF